MEKYLRSDLVRGSETSERESCCEGRQRTEQRKEMGYHVGVPTCFTSVHSLVHHIILKKIHCAFNSLQQWDPYKQYAISVAFLSAIQNN
jgi:hypothetical protein